MKPWSGNKIKLYFVIAILTVLLNVLAWNSTAFCDAYITYVFPVWVNTYGRLTGLFPFSVGEWMIAAGVLLAVCAALLAPATGAVYMVRMVRGRRNQTAAEGRAVRTFRCFAKGFYAFFAWTLLAVSLIMTLNCFILYHASTFSQKYFGEDTKEHTLEELFLLYNRIAGECNRLSALVERDEDGTIIYPGTEGRHNGEGETEKSTGRAAFKENAVYMKDKAVENMQALGKTYPRLDGYYPRPKPLLSSDFMCQQYMQGYYFPFSMEANYNDVMYILNKPATMCHELAHLRGYIFEDEANFISYLACVQSDDVIFQYSGYLSVLPYVVNDLNREIMANPQVCMEAAKKTGMVRLSEKVLADDIFVTDEEWERINKKALVDTETVDKISDTFVDTTLKINGVADGSVSYSRVVELLLQYYGE